MTDSSTPDRERQDATEADGDTSRETDSRIAATEGEDEGSHERDGAREAAIDGESGGAEGGSAGPLGVSRRGALAALAGAGMLGASGSASADTDDDPLADVQDGDSEDHPDDVTTDAVGEDSGDGSDDTSDDGRPERVEPSPAGLSREPPDDAVILWDGDTVTLDQWEHTDASPIDGEQGHGDPVAQIETDEYIEIDPGQGDFRPEIDGIGGDIGDCHLHIEWMTPEFVEGEGEQRGNSGIFLMERYEIQVLDNFENETDPGNGAGSYFSADATNALPVRPQGEWNEFDLFWRAAVIEDDQVVRYPQLTVVFNGVCVKYHYDVPGPNWAGIHPFTWGPHPHPEEGKDGQTNVYHEVPGGESAPMYALPGQVGRQTYDYGVGAEEWPFYIQDHGQENNVARYRNIWYRDQPDRPLVDGEHVDAIEEYDSSHGGDEAPDRVGAGGPGTTGEPPEDAAFLIDEGLTLQPGDGDWASDDAYGDVQLHLEYRIPDAVEGDGPERGSSGVAFQGQYEINIVDTWNNAIDDPTRWAGAYTHQAPPHADAVRPPGEWQHLDILWQSPRFESGEVSKPARVTAILNGVVVQDRLLVDGPNVGDSLEDYEEHGREQIVLRENGSEIDFRNVWVREQETAEL